jgi:Superinfection immunity protein
MQVLADSAGFWVLMILALCVLYLLPTLIAVIRRADLLAVVFVVNLIGGTTGVGWLAALILAFGPRRLPPVPPVPWPPPCSPPAHWPPQGPAEAAEARSVVVLHADAGEPDHFGRGQAGSRGPPRRGAGGR